jgi:hypothetical protein
MYGSPNTGCVNAVDIPDIRLAAQHTDMWEERCDKIASIVQLEYLVATVQRKLRSGRAGPFVKVEGCCD